MFWFIYLFLCLCDTHTHTTQHTKNGRTGLYGKSEINIWRKEGWHVMQSEGQVGVSRNDSLFERWCWKWTQLHALQNERYRVWLYCQPNNYLCKHTRRLFFFCPHKHKHTHTQQECMIQTTFMHIYMKI